MDRLKHTPMKHDVRIIFQGADGLWPVGNQVLSSQQLDRLVALMPHVGWITVTRPGVVHANDQTLLDPMYSKLQDSTLREIAEEKELSDQSTKDIINVLKDIHDDKV